MRKQKLYNVTIMYRGDYPGGGGHDKIHTRVTTRVANRPEQAIASVQRKLEFSDHTVISLTAREVITNV
jgi:hypothetical protein